MGLRNRRFIVRSPRSALALAAVVVGMTACGSSDDASDTAVTVAADAPSATVSDADGDFLGEAGPTVPASDGGDITGDVTGDMATPEIVPPSGEAPPDFDLGTIGRDVIVELHVRMTSDDLARTVAAITARAAALGGGVASSDVDYGTLAEPVEGAVIDTDTPPARVGGYAVVVVKVPPKAVNPLVDGLDDSGTVVAMNQSAADVTEQLVALDIRIDNARISVENVRKFLAQATNLTDQVALEAELTRRVTELEQLEAQQRSIGDRVAMSTVTIEISPTPVAAPAPDKPVDGIGDAFRRGWHAFVDVVTGIGLALATLSPFLVAAAIVGALTWWVKRRGRRRDGDGPPPPAEASAVPDDRPDFVNTSPNP